MTWSHRRVSLLPSVAVLALLAGCVERPAQHEAAAPRSVPQGVVTLGTKASESTECAAGGHALLLPDEAEFPDSSRDTGIGVLLHRANRRGDAVFSGPWEKGEYGDPGTREAIAIRARPAPDAPVLARFEREVSAGEYPACEYVVPADTGRTTPLLSAAFHLFIGAAAGLPVDSVSADSLWARVFYAQDSAGAHLAGWVRLGESGVGWIPWPRLLVNSAGSSSELPNVLDFRTTPTIAELRSLLRSAPNGPPAALSFAPATDLSDAWLDVLEVRGEWVRVRLFATSSCGPKGKPIAEGWSRLVNERGRTPLMVNREGCAD